MYMLTQKAILSKRKVIWDRKLFMKWENCEKLYNEKKLSEKCIFLKLHKMNAEKSNEKTHHQEGCIQKFMLITY